MRRPAAVLALGAVLVVAGCGGGEVELPSGPSSDLQSEDASPEAVPGGEVGSYTGDLPAEGECVAMPSEPEGLYTIGEAGSVTVLLEDDALVLDEVEPAEGWTHSVATEEPTEITVELTGEGRSLVFEATLEDDGAPQAQICDDEG